MRNSRSEKTKKEINDKVSQILLLCILINQQTDYCVFSDFSGHINQLTVRICESKERYNRVLIDQDMYLDFRHDEPKTLFQKMDRFISFLSETLEKNIIDFGKLVVSKSGNSYRLFKSHY